MSSDEKILFDTLYSKYRKVALSKKEMSGECGVSISTLDRLRRKGEGCGYIKSGNGDVFYPLTELVKYFTRVI